MIKITVELLSAKGPRRYEVLGIAYISNDGKKSQATGGRLGDYLYRLTKRGGKVHWKGGAVRDFQRVLWKAYLRKDPPKIQ